MVYGRLSKSTDVYRCCCQGCCQTSVAPCLGLELAERGESSLCTLIGLTPVSSVHSHRISEKREYVAQVIAFDNRIEYDKGPKSSVKSFKRIFGCQEPDPLKGDGSPCTDYDE